MEDTHTFANSEQTFQKHKALQQKITNVLKNHLKGPDVFTEPFLSEFLRVIFVPHNFKSLFFTVSTETYLTKAKANHYD